MATSYTGKIAAAYVNTSKKGKEYATFYIVLPDANGNMSSYKGLVFKDELVAGIKQATPEALKGKELQVEGTFKENTWGGKSEWQLMVDEITFPSEFNITTTPASQDNAQQPAGANPPAAQEVPATPVAGGVPSMPSTPSTPSTPTVPEIPAVPGIPG